MLAHEFSVFDLRQGMPVGDEQEAIVLRQCTFRNGGLNGAENIAQMRGSCALDAC